MTVTVITPPAVALVSLAEARDQARIDVTADDASLEGMIMAAEDYAAGFTNRALLAQTLELTLDGFPPCILVPRPPLTAVATIKYTDTAGVEQTIAAADYQVDTASAPGRIRPAFGKTWPSVRPEMNTVRVRYTAGYAQPRDLPREIRQAILMLITHFYDHREITVTGTIISDVPKATDALLWPYRVWTA